MKIHFIGIGGIGVSALARYFLARGNEVSGSDMAEGETVEELRALGVKISTPLKPLAMLSANFSHLPLEWSEHAKSPRTLLSSEGEQVDLVIYSAAVPDDNPELAAARQQGIKTQKYAEALGGLTKEKFTIAVSGMHGKSTTTAMIGLIMEAAGLDPTVIVGTKVGWNQSTINKKQSTVNSENYSNFRAGKSKYLVIEADEYDKSILNYWPKILVLLNLEEEHLDTYTGGLPEIMKAFEEYILHLSEDGILVANGEDKNINKIFNFQFSIFNENTNSKFKIQRYNLNPIKNLNLKIPGRHNLSNANAALAVARVLGIDEKIAVDALNNFSGAWRRMEYKGEVSGAKIYDDYGHHPTEIKATLEGARSLLPKRNAIVAKLRTIFLHPSAGLENETGKLWCVFQPHQYRRTYELFDEFSSAFDMADKVILLPIYSVAGREDEEIKIKVSSKKLAQTINGQQSTINSKKEILYIGDFDEAAEYLKKNLRAGDICVIMGAGDIYKLTKKLF